MQSLLDFLGGFARFIEGAVGDLLDSLNPWVLVTSTVGYSVAMMPPKSTVYSVVYVDFLIAFLNMLEYVRVFDYFINMPFLGLCLGVVVALEAIMFIPRIWWLLKSFVI